MENIAEKQAAMAQETMAKAQEQYQAHAFQQMMAKAAEREVPQEQGMER